MVSFSVTSPEEALELLSLPDAELFSRAEQLRREASGHSVHLCAIINIRSGHCGMDCHFCAQSRHNPVPQAGFPLLKDAVLRERILALAETPVRRIGLVASGGALDGEDFERVLRLVTALPAAVRGRLCASFGRLDDERMARVAACGITRYHHNLETSAGYYPQVCSTQRWKQRRDTARRAQAAGLSLCCGGIFGLGETWEDRISLAFTLRELGVRHVPLNFLHPQAGTPLARQEPLTAEEALRIIAVFRHILPGAALRICGGRPLVLGRRQGEIFTAGANALMTGDYLTTSGESLKDDLALIAACGMEVPQHA
ncbi:MAG: biotin synthase BioB [Desulfovibrio sp.]|uniref:biotin synthase BioB n=1 Tax=Desulfovibrio sp. TaxID=885 RepID=UPI001A74B44C|nr:biotin synthase BioB [Desulfovibrio sp.]MBD5417180.1 biotin synthase BioB [Desulfovibrio sp.]